MFLLRTLVVLSVALVPSPTRVCGPAPLDDEAAIREKIERFLSDPMEGVREGDMAAIAKFADESDRVAVSISGNVCAWTLSDMNEALKLPLLTAFLAGNVRSQLDTGTTQDDSYSGIVQTLRVYRALKSKQSKFKEASLEKYLAMQAKGELNQHILDLRAADDGKAKKDTPPPKGKEKEKKKP
jgi:hypothetical protein